MKYFDNITNVVRDDMKETITKGSRVSLAAACFSIYAFQELKLHKVYLNVLSENVRAQRFYEKCGFIQEGIAKDAVRIKESYKSLIWYGIFEENDKE